MLETVGQFRLQYSDQAQGALGSLVATPSLLSRVIESQGQDTEILSIRDRVLSGTSDKGWAIHTDGSLRYRGRVVVPQLTDLRRGLVKFDKREKLESRYIGPFEVLKRVDIVAYRLALPPSLSGVHEVFHFSMLRKYTLDPAHVVDWGEIIVDTDGTFEEGSARI